MDGSSEAFRPMIALSCYYFMQAVLTVVTLYYLPLYLQHEGYTVAQVGLIVSAGAVTSIVAQPLWGIIADRWRRMKLLLILLLVLALAAGSMVFRMESLLPIVVVFSMFMFFYSPVSPLADTMAMDYTARSGSSYGSIRLWGSAGLSLGSLLLGAAAGRLGITPLPAVFAATTLLLILVASQLPGGRRRQVKRLELRHLRELMSDRRYLGYLAVTMIMAVPFRMNDQLFSVYMKLQGATDYEVGLSWSIATLCSVPAYFLSGRLVRRHGEVRLLLFAGWMFAVRWVTLAPLQDPIWLIVHQVMNSVTVPILYFTAIPQVSKLVPPHLQATGQAVFTAVFAGVAGFIGGTAGGWGMERFEPGMVYLAGGGITAIGTLLTIVWSNSGKKRRAVYGAERIL